MAFEVPWLEEGVSVVWDSNIVFIGTLRKCACILPGDRRQILIFRMTFFLKTENACIPIIPCWL